MTKKEWENLYTMLNRLYSEFSNHYSSSLKGKTKAIRVRGENEASATINTVVYQLKKNKEALFLLLDTNSPMHNFLALSEFKEVRYFNEDMPKLLDKIEAHIKSLG